MDIESFCHFRYGCIQDLTCSRHFKLGKDVHTLPDLVGFWFFSLISKTSMIYAVFNYILLINLTSTRACNAALSNLYNVLRELYHLCNSLGSFNKCCIIRCIYVLDNWILWANNSGHQSTNSERNFNLEKGVELLPEPSYFGKILHKLYYEFKNSLNGTIFVGDNW